MCYPDFRLFILMQTITLYQYTVISLNDQNDSKERDITAANSSLVASSTTKSSVSRQRKRNKNLSSTTDLTEALQRVNVEEGSHSELKRFAHRAMNYTRNKKCSVNFSILDLVKSVVMGPDGKVLIASDDADIVFEKRDGPRTVSVFRMMHSFSRWLTEVIWVWIHRLRTLFLAYELQSHELASISKTVRTSNLHS